MTTFSNITIEDAKKLMAETKVTLADIRDQESYSNGHISNALHVTNENLQDFIRGADLDKPLIVYCYHGHSSQVAANFLVEQGFDEVYSLIGGYTGWQSTL